MSSLLRLATFDKGEFIWLEQFATVDKVVEHDFYFGSIQVKLFNKCTIRRFMREPGNKSLLIIQVKITKLRC